MYQFLAKEQTLVLGQDLGHAQVAQLEKDLPKLKAELKTLTGDNLKLDFTCCKNLDTSGFAFLLILLRYIQQDNQLKTKQVQILGAEKIKVYSTLYDLEGYLAPYF
ncbi:hypothetical protein [Psittacicella hinzii]|uniref:STAS domain-containing protein n=1 Tax=Psittacicella hinzii TaxID=2028575 RepID=A0A3A1YQT8_9GAMM|nr:hypothetical protein [Psittacicella hinzii]RIY39568.1 hypothetical protein CKF58_01905 [Psittacicella hinzii]